MGVFGFLRQLEPNAGRSMAWVGSYSLQKASVRYMGIYQAITHPEYQAVGGGYRNDIALVKLKKKLQFSATVAPVKLPSSTDTFGPSSECWITGWGYVGTTGTFCTYIYLHYIVMILIICNILLLIYFGHIHATAVQY